MTGATVLFSLLVAAVPVKRTATPTFSPSAGTYSSTQSVTVSTSSTGATIYCTVDGSAPARKSTLRYTSPISVASSETLKCQAWSSLRRPSLVATAAYTISSGTCANEATHGTITYFCQCGTGAQGGCVAGNDGNTGASEAQAKSSWSEIQNVLSSQTAGNTIALCKGGAWAGSDIGQWSATSCNDPAHPCDIREYTPSWGGSNKPRINSGDFTAYNGSGGPTIFNGVRFMNLDFRNLTVGIGNGARHLTFCGSDFSGNNTFFNDSTAGDPPDLLGADYFTLQDNTFTNMPGGISVLLQCDHCTIERNYWTACQGAGANNHCLYIGTGYHTSGGIVVRDNEFTATGCTGGPPFTVHGTTTDMSIEDNYFHDTAGDCTPIDLSCGFTPTNANCTALRPIIRRNRVSGYGGVAIRLAETQDALLEDNLIISNSGGNGDSVIRIHTSPGDDTCTGGVTCLSQGTVVRNNTIYVTGSNYGPAIDIGSNGNATNYVVTGNSIYSSGGLSDCYGWAGSTINYWDYNLCNGATFNPPTGKDTHGLTSAPQFVSPTSDFHPANGSPLINAASPDSTCRVLGSTNQPCSSTTAIKKNTWDNTESGVARDANPDIGAFEYGVAQ